MKKLNKFKTIYVFLVAAILLMVPTYLIRFNIFGIPTTLLEIYIYLVFILCLSEKVISKGRVLSKPLLIPVILFVIAIISSFLAIDTMASLGQTKAIFFDGILVFIMFYCFRDDINFKKLSLNFYALSGLIVAIWGLLQRMNVVGLIRHQLTDPLLASQISQGRILGPFESPNYLAMFLAPLLILLVIDYLRRTNLLVKRYLFWSLLLLLLIAIVLTQSASAMLAIVVTLAFYFILNIKTKIKWSYLGILIICVFIGVYLLGQSEGKSGSVASRVEIYKATIEIGKTHQIFGIGVGNFPQYFLNLDIPGRLNWEAMHPHNVFLAFWAYMGWSGLIAFLALITICLRKENFEQQPLYYFAFLCILINGLTDTTIFKNDLAIIFWYLVAFLI